MNNTVPVITLDGPSGTGKGTLCHLLAKKLNWHFLDSGALYRVLAFAAKKNNIDYNNVNQLVDLAHGLHLRFELEDTDTSLVILDDENISEAIRSEQCGQQASQIAAIPEVRAALLERQRAFATYPSEQERAMRRHLQLKEKNIHVSLAQVVDELAKRDARDMARTHSPLKPADDAVLIDTTGLTVLEVFEKVLKLTPGGS